MDFLNLAKERFSARAFSAQAVEEDKVNYLWSAPNVPHRPATSSLGTSLWLKRRRRARRYSNVITANG